MDDSSRLAAARTILQQAAAGLHQLAGPAAFELIEEVLATELAAPARRSRCYIATGMMALLPRDAFDDAGHVGAEATSPLLPEARRRADEAADAILRLWGDARRPAREDETDEHPDDTVRSTVWLLLGAERPLPASDDGDDPDEDLDDPDDPDDLDVDDDPDDPDDLDEDDEDDQTGEAEESTMERVHDWFDRTFHHHGDERTSG